MSAPTPSSASTGSVKREKTSPAYPLYLTVTVEMSRDGVFGVLDDVLTRSAEYQSEAFSLGHSDKLMMCNEFLGGGMGARDGRGTTS